MVMSRKKREKKKAAKVVKGSKYPSQVEERLKAINQIKPPDETPNAIDDDRKLGLFIRRSKMNRDPFKRLSIKEQSRLSKKQYRGKKSRL